MKLPSWLAERGVKRIIGLDFETYWDKDYTLKKMSTTGYVRDKRFKAHCVGLQQHDATKAVWYRDKDIKHALARVDWKSTAVLCHHAHFDGLILTHHFGHTPAFYLCTLSMARPLHGGEIRNDLEELSRYYGGRGKLDDYLEGTKGIYNLYDGEHRPLGKRLGEGCARDVEEMWRIFGKMLPQYPLDELALIHHTVRAYTEPVLRVDIPRAKKAHADEVARKEKVLSECGEEAEVLRSRDKFAALLRDAGIEPPMKLSPRTGFSTYAFAKTDLEFQALSEHPKKRVRVLVEAREIVSSSLAETRPLRLVEHATPALPVYLNYGKAHTLRWSGGDKVNLQNLSKAGDLRSCIKAPPGHTLVIGDSAQIEARFVAWWAGQDDLVEAFRSGTDIYSKFAEEEIYHYPVNKKDTPIERTVGKVCVLGLGFYMGAEKFKYSLNAGIMTGGEGIYLDDPAMYKQCVQGYRKRFNKIPALWKTMDGALRVMYEGGEMVVGPITFVKGGAVLPNGMALRYPNLKPGEVINGDDEEGKPKKKKKSSFAGAEFEQQTTYRDWTYDGHKIYSGLLTENIVQSAARLVVAQQALRVADAYRIVLLVHDEIVLCVPDRQAKRAALDLEKAMSTPLDWCDTLPVACEIQTHEEVYEMKIAEGYNANFNTMLRAAEHNRLCLLDVRERATGNSRVAVCAISGPDETGELTFTPFALMIDGNPYEMFDPPSQDGSQEYVTE